MKKQDIIWAAGFMDGEGTITIKRYLSKSCKRGITFQPYVSCGQTIKGIVAIEKLKEIFGGSISQWEQTGNRLDTIGWATVSRQALQTVKSLLPFLVLKRKQAEIIIAFYKRHKGRGKHLTDKEFVQKEQQFFEMRKLNTKGVLRLKRLSEETPKGDATV